MSAGIYLHIPFCRSRCSYCDFATDIWRSNDAVERYVTALCQEVRTACVSGRPVRGAAVSLPPLAPTTPAFGQSSSGRTGAGGADIDTVYFGGGTPSLLTPQQVESILTTVYSQFDIEPNAEITMEMNPATVSPYTLNEYRKLGVNRASFGVQTFDDRALKLLARGHDAHDARTTFDMLRKAGFDNISFDLIAGLPGQTLKDWKSNLNEAIAMAPEHMSLYLLEIHESTPLAEQVRSKRQPQPDPELAAEMYELMLNRLDASGYEQYEISNFSRPGRESRHNSKYWTLDPVIGFGVSAHSFDGKQRYANERDTAKYVQMIECSTSAEVFREDTNLASEFVFLGLRMEAGIDLDEVRRRFGTDLLADFQDDIDRLLTDGLIAIENAKMRLTHRGKLYSNEVFAVFV